MTSGHLACHDCKLTLHIGAVIHAPDGTPHGFGHGRYSSHDLSSLIEAFIAIHLEHRIEVIAEQDFDMRDWTGYDSVRPVPSVPAAIAKARFATVGPITVCVEPFGGPRDAATTQRSG
tara:strand:+ start:115 stop:468 length:354 start_codon:yes stop_codon:yes gene_type:complete